MAHVYAALTLLKAGKKPTLEALKKVLEVAGVNVPESDINVLLILIEAARAVDMQENINDDVEGRLKKLEDEVHHLSIKLEEVVKTLQSIQFRIPTHEKPSVEEEGRKPMKHEDMRAGTSEARYIYCVAYNCGKSTLGKIGLNGCEVYTIPFKDICAVVHACHPEPYKSDDRKIVEGWVLAHEEVVEKAMELYGTVIPVSFNTIIIGGDNQVEEWLNKEYSHLKALLEKLRDKEEYGIQIFLDKNFLKEELEKDEELTKLSEEFKGKPGIEYFYKQKIEKILKERMEAKVKTLFDEFYTAIRACVEDVHVEKVKESEGEIMIANFSVLVRKENVGVLKKILEDISSRKGFKVRFTGPWPPYSFVK